jgi:hypothetical protein
MHIKREVRKTNENTFFTLCCSSPIKVFAGRVCTGNT